MYTISILPSLSKLLLFYLDVSVRYSCRRHQLPGEERLYLQIYVSSHQSKPVAGERSIRQRARASRYMFKSIPTATVRRHRLRALNSSTPDRRRAHCKHC